MLGISDSDPVDILCKSLTLSPSKYEEVMELIIIGQTQNVPSQILLSNNKYYDKLIIYCLVLLDSSKVDTSCSFHSSASLQVTECSLPLPPAIPASLSALVGTSCSYSGLCHILFLLSILIIEEVMVLTYLQTMRRSVLC